MRELQHLQDFLRNKEAIEAFCTIRWDAQEMWNHSQISKENYILIWTFYETYKMFTFSDVTVATIEKSAIVKLSPATYWFCFKNSFRIPKTLQIASVISWGTTFTFWYATSFCQMKAQLKDRLEGKKKTYYKTENSVKKNCCIVVKKLFNKCTFLGICGE